MSNDLILANDIINILKIAAPVIVIILVTFGYFDQRRKNNKDY